MAIFNSLPVPLTLLPCENPLFINSETPHVQPQKPRSKPLIDYKLKSICVTFNLLTKCDNFRLSTYITRSRNRINCPSLPWVDGAPVALADGLWHYRWLQCHY